MIREFNYNIGTESAGKTIEEFLRRLGYSHHVIVGLKRTENGICLNGLWAYTNQRMKEHDILSVHLEESESSPGIIPAPVAFEIVYEDEDLMVIDKPADTPIHPSQGNYDNTLANGVAYYFAQQNIPYVYRCINRLDRDTTGLLILAKHGISGAALSAQMMERRIHRTYHALAEGHTPSEGTIDAPIARKEGSTIERCVDFTHGETAITHYHTLSHESSKNGLLYSRVELHLETGRTHQIRVHMHSIGHPLLGDTLYRPENPFGLEHQALHSYSLEFLHPVTGKNFIFQNRSPGKSITTSSLRIDVRPGIMIEKNVEDLNQTVLPRSFLLNTR